MDYIQKIIEYTLNLLILIFTFLVKIKAILVRIKLEVENCIKRKKCIDLYMDGKFPIEEAVYVGITVDPMQRRNQHERHFHGLEQDYSMYAKFVPNMQEAEQHCLNLYKPKYNRTLISTAEPIPGYIYCFTT